MPSYQIKYILKYYEIFKLFLKSLILNIYKSLSLFLSSMNYIASTNESIVKLVFIMEVC